MVDYSKPPLLPDWQLHALTSVVTNEVRCEMCLDADPRFMLVTMRLPMVVCPPESLEPVRAEGFAAAVLIRAFCSALLRGSW